MPAARWVRVARPGQARASAECHRGAHPSLSWFAPSCVMLGGLARAGLAGLAAQVPHSGWVSAGKASMIYPVKIKPLTELPLHCSAFPSWYHLSQKHSAACRGLEILFCNEKLNYQEEKYQLYIKHQNTFNLRPFVASLANKKSKICIQKDRIFQQIH